jgi:Hemerythrin HHE cation binding domain
MAEPLDVIMAFHNAFRRDMSRIDAAALDSARGKPGLAPTVERFRFFNEVLVWHALGEERAVFPAVEAVAPSVAEAYERDHRGLDAAFDALSAAVSAHDALDTARASAAFKFHLDIHLGKEDAHLYRLVRERVPLADQAKAVGIMASIAPQDRFPEVVRWLYSLLGDDDRENVTRIFQTMMPPPVFAGAKQLIQAAIGNDWAELTRRIPALAESGEV